MISLNDAQLKTVMAAASHVPVEKRDLYLQRVAAMLTLRGRGHFTDRDVSDAADIVEIVTVLSVLGAMGLVGLVLYSLAKPGSYTRP